LRRDREEVPAGSGRLTASGHSREQSRDSIRLESGTNRGSTGQDLQEGLRAVERQTDRSVLRGGLTGAPAGRGRLTGSGHSREQSRDLTGLDLRTNRDSIGRSLRGGKKESRLIGRKYDLARVPSGALAIRRRRVGAEGQRWAGRIVRRAEIVEAIPSRAPRANQAAAGAAVFDRQTGAMAVNADEHGGCGGWL